MIINFRAVVFASGLEEGRRHFVRERGRSPPAKSVVRLTVLEIEGAKLLFISLCGLLGGRFLSKRDFSPPLRTRLLRSRLGRCRLLLQERVFESIVNNFPLY